MNNFYNSYDLSTKMLNDRINACGTLISNRKAPDCESKLKKEVKKGVLACFTKKRGNIYIWRDKRTGYFVSTGHSIKFDHEEIEYAENKLKNLAGIKIIKHNKKPVPIIEYNQNMEGVDRSDQIIKYYPLIRRKKYGL